MLILFLFGYSAYNAIPKEDAPEVKVPYIYASVYLNGISPEDARKSLLKPMEQYFKEIDGIKKMTSYAVTSVATVILEFDANFDSDQAMVDVREKIDMAKAEFPQDAEEPVLKEIDLSKAPVLNVILKGDVDDSVMLEFARTLQDEIETVKQVLEVDISGDKEDLVEIEIEPDVLERYNITLNDLNFINANNSLVASGAMRSNKGEFSVKIPGLIEEIDDIANIPVKIVDNSVIKLGDIAKIKKTYYPPTSIAYVNGQRSLVLEVVKKTGENTIQAVENVKKLLEEYKGKIPPGIELIFARDGSDSINESLSNLNNNIILAVLVVVLIVFNFIGVREGLFVAVTIPLSFLMGVFFIYLMGFTVNIVVLFGLILASGLIVDNAIVVVEYASYKIKKAGLGRKEAYEIAAIKMFMPVLSSTLTTLTVFAPLLFWPGIMGQFMKYLPITLISVLASSFITAIFFLPAIGAVFSKKSPVRDSNEQDPAIMSEEQILKIKGFTGKYAKILSKILNKPRLFVASIILSMFAMFIVYGKMGAGVEFFPSIEPEYLQLSVRARGNMSIEEKDKIAKTVYEKIKDMEGKEIKIIYNKVASGSSGSGDAKDLIAKFDLHLTYWKFRPKAKEITKELREKTAGIAGVKINITKESGGPTSDKPFSIELSSLYPEDLEKSAQKLFLLLSQDKDLVDLDDSRAIPTIEYKIDFNKSLAALNEVSISTLGAFARMVTNGNIVSVFRPNYTDEEVKIVTIFPEEYKSLDTLKNIKIPTANGLIPASNFIDIIPQKETSEIFRVDSRETVEFKAAIAPTAQLDKKIREWYGKIESEGVLLPNVNFKFTGDTEDQMETMNFLKNAFGTAMLIMFLILLCQFNSIFKAVVIMSSIILAITGVLLGLLITQYPFGIVMSGVGIIALAGIVVNNNIILIDTYGQMRDQSETVRLAVIRTAVLRLKPILVTTATTIIGVLPMVTGVTLNFFTGMIDVGAPSSQWWTQLSTSIAGGIAFATILTLFFTPAVLLLEDRIKKFCKLGFLSKVTTSARKRLKEVL